MQRRKLVKVVGFGLVITLLILVLFHSGPTVDASVKKTRPCPTECGRVTIPAQPCPDRQKNPFHDVTPHLTVQDEKRRLQDLEKEWLVLKRGIESTKLVPEEEKVVQKKLDDFVLGKLERQQFPEDCSTAKYMLCDITDYKCGFGCQFHGIARCLAFAYSSGRVAEVYPAKLSRYEKPWNYYFKPLSGCSDYLDKVRAKGGNPSPSSTAQFLQSGGPYPLSNYWVDPEIAEDLKKYHKDGPLWFFGRMVSYAFRLSDQLKEEVENAKKSMGMAPGEKPDFSIHIRRTDKLRAEGWFHHFAEYLYPIDRHLRMEKNYRTWEKSSGKSVFVASDEPAVEDDFASFPQYNYLWNRRVADTAAVNTRNSHDGLVGIIIDVQICSEAEFFVGTFSSQLSRVIVEIIAANHFHPYYMTESLDEGWYIGV